MRKKLLLKLVATFVGTVTAMGLVGAPASASPSGGWEGTWTASPQRPGAGFSPNWSVAGFADQTVRQVVRISQGGPSVRVHLTNVYGSAPLAVTGATVGRAGTGAAATSVRPLTFGHSRSVVIPVGHEISSDAAPLPVRPLESLTVTIYFATQTGAVTYHADAEATSFRAPGDHRSDAAGTAFTETSTSWYALAGVDVADFSPRRDVVVTFGDSITDGAFAGVDQNARYPDELAERLHGRLGVLNAGIGGNRVLNDSQCLGDKATTRFRPDALAQPHLRTVIVLEGINDIGASEFNDFDCFKPNPRVAAAELIAGHRELIRQAHTAGVRIVGATLLPYKGAVYYTPAGDQVRTDLNNWIRTSGEYDAVIDFDRAMAAPTDANAMNPTYDSGDHLHPNAPGYHAMAEAINLHTL
ncbi:SGNH/GDSL hydrolase family protein [Actinocrispum wychmicini]|uniref:Lysophospholipase L1-like esterase n=1 Tax=Actinocrispum wychmicini TaxID=1213861 RepID=A0A4R2JGR4_9PSEU|nr:SGNH/GDSL hydrolase family protein [Actinocrispum wychmicini]TCO58224.1 lysophospholipase L1-like esterase [Actinocrispum wychmicini]